ncbi:MAG: PTS sugar transporter subunit IIA [Treponema sp.]|nr:PTS sugar transporter subunit IIA [Treponema sp.]
MTNLLSDVFELESIKLNIDNKTKENIFEDLISIIVKLHPEYNTTEILSAVKQREDKMSTGIGSGVAIPHAYCKGIAKMVGAIGVSKEGIDYAALDNKPVYVVFLFIGNEPADENHLNVLNRIYQVAQSEKFIQIKNAKKAETIYEILSKVHLM